MNNWNAVGFISRMQDQKVSPNGVAYICFTVAIRNMSAQKTMSFVDCVAFGKTAEFLSKYFVTGSPIGIEAEVRNNNYLAKNGNMQYTYNFVVKQVHFVGKKESNPAVAMRAQTVGSIAPTPMPSAAAQAASGALPFPPAPSTQPVPSAAPPMTATDADGLGQGLKLGKLSDVFTADEMTLGTSAEAC